jgi:hypothetical protein
MQREKRFIITMFVDDGQTVPVEALFQVIMNGLANGHPFNLGVSGLKVEEVKS